MFKAAVTAHHVYQPETILSTFKADITSHHGHQPETVLSAFKAEITAHHVYQPETVLSTFKADITKHRVYQPKTVLSTFKADIAAHHVYQPEIVLSTFKADVTAHHVCQPETFLSTLEHIMCTNLRLFSTFKADVTASLPAFRVSKPSRFRLMSPLFRVTLLGLSVTSGQSGLTSQVAMRTSTRGSARDIADLSAGTNLNRCSGCNDVMMFFRLYCYCIMFLERPCL